MIVALDLLPRVVVTGNKQSGMLEIFLMNKNSKFDERSFQCSWSMTKKFASDLVPGGFSFQ